MKRILGLDLGTTSIGWALINEAENDSEKSSIIKLGVRVNPLTVDEQQDFEKGKRDYKFRRHLETSVKDTKELKNITYRQYKTLFFANLVVKIRVNHIGQIVSIGEY
jgi:RNase H-fold protein (predicted Holliday junction resolvase)